MKRVDIFSLSLIILMTMLYAALSWGYYEGDLNGIRYFGAMLLVRTAIIGAIGALLWHWPFKKRITPAFFCFSVIYSLVLLQASIATALELEKKNRAVQEVEAMKAQTEIREKTYSQEEYGEYVSLLHFLQKFSLFHQEEIAAQQKIREALDYEGMLSCCTLGDKEKMIAARKRLHEAYFNINAMQKRAINYYINLIRIFENKTYRNWVLKKEFDDIFGNLSDTQIDYCYDLYDLLRSQLYAYDDLLVFIINRQGFCRHNNGQIAFDSALDETRYAAFLRKIDDLAQNERDIRVISHEYPLVKKFCSLF